MILLSHPTGNANVRQAARALNEAGLLAEFWTSVCWYQNRVSNLVLPETLCRVLNRRTYPHVNPKLIHCHPWREMGRLLASKVRLSHAVRDEQGWFSVDAVYRDLDWKVASQLSRNPDISAVYAYEDGAMETFCAAQRRGIRTIYELPIGYWKAYQELMLEEAELQPEWANTLRGNKDSSEKRSRKDTELEIASRIVVPSKYVQQTLNKAGPLKALISIIPYCGPPPRSIEAASRRAQIGKLRVIFVGSLGQRKGLSYLLKAIEMLGSSVELTLIGMPAGECKPLKDACRKHRWIPSLPHDDVLREIQQHDVMVFPSLFEGFGLVILEAIACGVPVIATPNGAAPEVLTDGEDGFIVPIRDAEAIATKLQMLILDRSRLTTMSRAALRKAARHSWEQYRERLVAMARQVLAQQTSSAPLTHESLLLSMHNS